MHALADRDVDYKSQRDVESLTISAVDLQGSVTGTLIAFSVSSPVLGLWDEDSQRLTFQVSVSLSEIGLPQQFFVYTGHLF